MNVGKPRTPSRATSSGDSSPSISTTLSRPANTDAMLSITGRAARQGGHQRVETSINTGSSAQSTWSSKLAASTRVRVDCESSDIGSSELQSHHRRGVLQDVSEGLADPPAQARQSSPHGTGGQAKLSGYFGRGPVFELGQEQERAILGPEAREHVVEP